MIQAPNLNILTDMKLPDIIDIKLDNGANVSMMQFGTLPTVHMQIVLNVGSISEIKDNQQWLSTFLANMMKEGSAKLHGQEIVEIFASYGGSIDISASDDHLFINVNVLSEFIDEAIKIVADVIRNPRFPKSEENRIKSDLLRNLELMLVDPQSITSARLNKLLFGNHPYGREFPDSNNLLKFNNFMLKDFYKKSIKSSESRIYLVGNFDSRQVIEQLHKSFGNWNYGEGIKDSVPKLMSPGQWSLINRENALQSTIKIAVKIGQFNIANYHSFIVLNALLGGTFISRITTNIREDKGYSYSPISHLSINNNHCFWIQSADVSTEVTTDSLSEIFYEIKKLSKNKIPKLELDGMIMHLAGLHLIRFSTPRSIIGQLFHVDEIGIERTFYESYISSLKSVDGKSIQDLMSQFFSLDDFYIAIAGDKKIIDKKIQSMQEFININEV